MAFTPAAILRSLAFKAPTRLHCAIYQHLRCLGICARKSTKRGTKGAGRNRRIPVWVTRSVQQSADRLRPRSAGANLNNIVSICAAADPPPPSIISYNHDNAIPVFTGYRPMPPLSTSRVCFEHLRPLPRSPLHPE